MAIEPGPATPVGPPIGAFVAVVDVVTALRAARGVPGPLGAAR